MMLLMRLFAPVLVFLVTSAAIGATIHVDDDAALGGDGQSWSSAFRYLQDALAAADVDPGITEIRVAGGVYKPDQDEAGRCQLGNPAAFFDTRGGLSISGGYRGLTAGGDPDDHDPEAFETVLSGDLNGDDAPGFLNRSDNSRIVISTSGVEADAVLQGLTIASAFGAVGGGGLMNTNGAPTIRNCTFRDNHGAWGGAIHSVGDDRLNAVDCTFINNRASNGGGAAMITADADFVNCRFLANHSYHNGGAVLSQASILIANCVFVGNLAGFEYGRCEGSPEGLGGAICQNEGDLTAVNCVFSHNFASETGGGVFLQQVDQAQVGNCIFYLNRRCAGIHNFGGAYSNYSLTYCCIETDWPGEHNIDADPLFAREPGPGADQRWGTPDDDYGVLRLLPESPCIDAGDNDVVPDDLLDMDADGDLAEYLPVDAGGLLRFANRLGTVDTGNGSPPIVDIGAYEYQCTGDLDGDGVVDLSDLATLLSNYGQCQNVLYQAGDLDGDGAVNLADLACLLSVYGTICD